MGGRRRRRKRETETPDFLKMVRRQIRRAGIRVGDADYVDLAQLVELRAELEAAIGHAAWTQAQRTGWTPVGEGLGVTRQAAFMRYRHVGQTSERTSSEHSASIGA